MGREFANIGEIFGIDSAKNGSRSWLGIYQRMMETLESQADNENNSI